MALLDNNKDVIPLSSVAELLTTKVRTLKIYEEKGLLPKKNEAKKLYSINDIKVITFVHYLANVKKINANGIKYVREIMDNNMDEKNKDNFLSVVEEKMEHISSGDFKDIELI